MGQWVHVKHSSYKSIWLTHWFVKTTCTKKFLMVLTSLMNLNLLSPENKRQTINITPYIKKQIHTHLQHEVPTINKENYILTHWGQEKKAAILQTFSNKLFCMKIVVFDSNFTEMSSQGSNSQYASTGSDNGLVLNRRQAIIWSNANPVHWHMWHWGEMS